MSQSLVETYARHAIKSDQQDKGWSEVTSHKRRPSYAMHRMSMVMDRRGAESVPMSPAATPISPWRTPRKPSIASSIGGGGGYVYGSETGSNYPASPRTRTRLLNSIQLKVELPEAYRIGQIIKAVHHEPSYLATIYNESKEALRSREAATNNTPDSPTPLGPVNSKVRRFVVVDVYGSHCVLLPMMTHGGRGLAGKNYKDEYILVCDARRVPEPPEGKKFDRQPLIAEKLFEGEKIPANDYVWITHPVSRDYTQPIKQVGMLDANSIARLLDYRLQCQRKVTPSKRVPRLIT
ncbi:MAG: hypothetical protein M1825_000548 [Sarcosagium campestre]|nr:MAG: hypothetical protein M1825_000548 [Sarcosagium campestre]